MEVFANRNWLRVWTDQLSRWTKEIDLCWYGSVGFQKVSKRLQLIGNARIKRTDPKESSRYAPWTFLMIDIREKRKWGLGNSHEQARRAIEDRIRQFKARCEHLQKSPPDDVTIRNWVVGNLKRNIQRLQAQLRRLRKASIVVNQDSV